MAVFASKINSYFTRKKWRFTGMPMVHKWLILILTAFTLALAHPSYAQLHHAANDTIRLGGIIIEQDTFAMVFLEEVYVHDKMPKRLAKQQEAWNRLRYNIYKVYPYAVVAADVMKDVDKTLAKIGNDKTARKAYLKTVEKELNKRFKGELENFSITQGQLLVKLIDRQTGKNCFSIIKEMKGGFSAVIWQGVALLFSNNLKREYDPTGDDKDIETIVREIETSNSYRYQRALQGK